MDFYSDCREPAVLFRTGLFSPYIFSLNGFIPSLGHLLLISILAAFSHMYFISISHTGAQRRKVLPQHYLVLSSMLVTGAFLIMLFHIVFSKLVSDSNINFETYKVLEIKHIQYCRIQFQLSCLLLVPVVYNSQSFSRPAGRQATRTLSVIGADFAS